MITFRLDAETPQSRDAIANGIGRGQNGEPGESVEGYLETQGWHIQRFNPIRAVPVGKAALGDRLRSTESPT